MSLKPTILPTPNTISKPSNWWWIYGDFRCENSSLAFQVDPAYHGTNGLLAVQDPPFETPILNQFLEAGQFMGYKLTDPNGKNHIGFSKTQATMLNGRRYSAAAAYLRPFRHRRSLKIVTRARVTKILIEPASKHAYGVVFVKGEIK